MAKNPFLSASLSQANRVANTVRGKATAAATREAKRQAAALTTAWFNALTPRPTRRRKAR